MQEDSVHSTTPGHMMHNEPVPQDSTVKSFHCSRCPLSFKSKVFLFEHLNNVHDYSVDASLRDAGLTGSNKASNDKNSDRTRSTFECQHCDFKACSWDDFKTHETCHKESDNQNVKEKTTSIISANQKAPGAKEISSSAMSTSKTKCTPNSSKDLKTYKKPIQTITKYFKASGSNGLSAVGSTDNPTLLDGTRDMLILQESPLSSGQKSSGVFKVSAKPMIDLSAVSQQFLLNDYLLNADLTPPTPKGHIKEAVFNNAGKRTCNESLISSPAKKVKVAREGKQDLLSSAEFSFEVSEDEEETSINLVNGDMESPKVYSCKHCDYSDVGIQGVSTHYQSDHPYVRYTSDYIQDPINQSATFRCLHCPIEFVSVASLKKHYTKNHPEAPNVFKMQLRELHLVFKCFLCSFTINALKSLRRHYKEKHPTHEVNNALMYSKYLATTSQEGSSQLNACEKTSSSERISTESAPVPCEEVKNAPSSQHATSKGADVVLFQCNKCKFSHKSVVVMHVHYQKSHPEEAITIDKIKQSSLVTSQTTPEKMSEPQKSVIITDKSTPQKKISDSHIQETKEKAKMPQQKISVAQINLKHLPETSKTHSESPKTKKVESAGDRTPAKRDSKMSTEMEHVSPTSPNAVFYCQFCSYSSTKIKSVVCHHNAKHSLHTQVGIQEIVKHSAEVRKKKLQSEAKATASASLSTSVTKCHAFARAEDLFYCQKCNYGNPSLKGVTTHQSKLHTSCKFSTESVIEYTALIRDEIKKSKSQAKESSISTGLPLPLLNEGDEHMFFCHFCNYRQSSMSRIVHHYSKTHCGFVSNAKEIRLHTSMVLEQTKKLPLKATANQEVDQTPVKEKRNKKKKTKGPGKSSSVSVSSSKKASQAQKTLQCPRCAYITQHVYLLRRHTRKMHGSHFKQGNLQSGYHCEYCVFSHKKATILDKHYQDKHPGRRPCVDLITARSNVGPGTSTPLRSGENETEIYPCRACSFKGRSVSGITDHYRSVHPWSVKEDGSVLDVINRKKPSAKKKMEDHSEISGSFESYQVPLEFDNSLDSPQEATESSTELKCPHCPAQFHADHSLKTHLGVEHRQNVTEEELQEEQLQVQTNVHIFKCPHCSYVNTNCEEVLCHCLKEHPTLESRADSLHVEEEHLNLQKGCSKGTDPDGMLRYIGYMCKTCPQIHSTLEELSKHCEEDHNQSVPNTPETALKPAQQSKTHRTQGSVKQGFSFKKKTHAVISCQVCFYKCTTKVALRRHMHTYHNNTPASSAQDCAYKCVICSKSFSQTRCLGYHYTRIHGKDAFHKYYAPVYHNVLKKSATTSADHPSNHMAENTSDASQSSTATEKNKKNVFKCPKCPYVNASHHGILTHCQMGHPALVARADDLKTIEILVTNMVGCKLGKSSNERGYMCKICPQIHASLKKLKIHLERDHGKEGSHKHNAKGNMPQPPPSVQEKFKCDMCAYSGARRRYLWRHYKVIHKLDALATSRRLVKYNKLGTKINYLPEAEPDSEESGQIKCKKCPNLVFYSLEMLSTHYSTSHSSDCKLDFIVLYPLSKKYKWVYKCCHCKKRLNGIKNLCLHMDYHKRKKTMENAAEEMAARTEASLVDTMTPEAKSTELCEQDELPALETVEKPDQSNVTLPTSPLSSPSKPADVEEPDQSNVTLPTSPLSSPSKPADVEEPDQSNVTLQTSPLSSPSKPAYVEEPDQSNVTLPTSPLSSPSKPADVEEPDQSNVTLPTSPLSSPSKPADVEEPDQSNVTLPTSPLSSPSKPADVQEPEPESREDKHTCKQCALTFMSLKGLRCHERSHAAVAAIKKLDNLPTSALKHTSIDKYVVFKSGTRRPFRCSICPYKTTVMALWKNHFIKSHQDIIMNPAETDNQDTENTQMAEKEPPNSSEELNNLPEPDEELEIGQRSMYLEPPEVQRQLNHFSLMAEAGPSSKAKVQDPKLPVNGLLHCEFCNFTTEHSSSIRRHLLNRHGKKMLRCKDCNFFTGLRKNLEMHIETGHSTFESGPTHQKDLRCPFCLYQTKNKNNMIDHIILHREERVVPIEVRRPKLSRYLQGIVFRCHKCTFTSASAENLHLHMKRHDDIKPYKCRLCYFDCSQLCNLEAHLCDKHQVVRNHALVGQVSLDQLEARGGRAPEEEEEEEPVSNLEKNNEVEYVETEELVMDCNEVSDDTHAKNPVVNFLRESMKLQIPQRQGSKKANAGSLTRHSAFILQCKNIANPNAAVPEKHGQDPQERTQNEMSSPDAAKRQGVEKRAEPKVAEDNGADVHFVDCSYPEKERQMSEKQLGGSVDSRKMAMQKTEEAAEGRLAGKAQARKLQMKAFQDRTSNIEAKVEDDILRHILLLDDDGSIHRTPRKAGYDRLVKIEQDIENEVVENVFSKIILLNEEDNITLAQHPKKQPEDTTAVTPKKNQECFTAERHLLSLTPNSAQVKMSRKKRVDKVSHCKEEHVHNQTNCEKLDYGAMPVLEKEPLNEEPLTRCKEEEEGGRLEKRQDRGDKVITETNKSRLKDWGHAEGSRMKEADDPCVSEGAVTAVDGAAEVRHSAVTEKKLFTCEFCGRNLTNSCELERHILRHGL